MVIKVSMSNPENKKLSRLRVGGLPLIRSIAERMGLREILSRYIHSHGNETVPATETLILLIYNLVVGKDPLYQLEEWVGSLDGRCLSETPLDQGKFNDDRFGRALDKLYMADRASLMTDLVISVTKAFNLDLKRIHNDSTSVKGFGRINGTTKTGVELKRGHSKEHRPDLKQLLFCLSISSDGAVPIHQKVYPGNRTDDTTHIETWNTLCKIRGNPNFLYVADSKLCTEKQLRHIVCQGGQAITIVPKTWGDVASFKNNLRKTKKAKTEIWRRKKPNTQIEHEYFSLFSGTYRSKIGGYQIHWIFSSEKRKRDRMTRENRLRKTEQGLAELNTKINARNLKTQQRIRSAAELILEKENTSQFFHLEVGTTIEEYRTQKGRGRPGKDTKYKRHVNTIYTLTWTRKKLTLREEANTDGVFPLLCTDDELSAKEVLQAYKYQPRLEKRFTQFRNIHRATPLLFKKIERVEANMFAFFIALMIQALIEREVRNKMKIEKLPSLPVYPEERESSHPTTSKIMDAFSDVSTYRLTQTGKTQEEFKDDLTRTQEIILRFLCIEPDDFWRATNARH